MDQGKKRPSFFSRFKKNKSLAKLQTFVSAKIKNTSKNLRRNHSSRWTSTEYNFNQSGKTILDIMRKSQRTKWLGSDLEFAKKMNYLPTPKVIIGFVFNFILLLIV